MCFASRFLKQHSQSCASVKGVAAPGHTKKIHVPLRSTTVRDVNDHIRTYITDIVFIFIFLFEYGVEYG